MKTSKAIIISIIMVLTIFLFCAFGAWQINPAKWSNEGRAFIAGFLFIIGLLTFAYIKSIKDENKD